MPNPTAGDVHVNRPLTNMSIAFLQKAENFVAARVFPNIPVDKQSDLYFEYNRGDFNRDEAKLRAPGTESAGGGYRVTTASYFADVHAFHKDIPDQIRSNADMPLSQDREATEYVTHKALIRREKDWAAKYFATGKWTTDITGVDAAPATGEVLQWDDDSSTPIEDLEVGIQTILGSTGFRPNTLVVGSQVWSELKNHPDVVERVKYSSSPGNPAVVTKQSVAALLEIERILEMQAIENTAAEGLAAVHSFIGGKKALLVYAAPTPGIMTPSAGYTFSWNGYLGAGAQGNRIKMFRMEHLASDRVEIEMAWAQKLIAADMGYFFNSIVA